MDLAVIVPSRSRPLAAFDLARNFEATCTASTRLIFVVDDDDPLVGSYRAVPPSATIWTVTTSGMVPALNYAANHLAGSTIAVGFMGDDHRPRTKGWDAQYLAALDQMGTGIVYGDDLLQGAALPTQCAMTSNIVRVLGYMAPPPLHHLYIDNFWRDLGLASDRLRYLPDVVVEHMHPIANKASWDEGYKRVNSAETYDVDSSAYHQWKAANFEECVAKVKAL